MTAVSRYQLTKADLGNLLQGEPRYRTDQIWSGLYNQLAEPEDLSNLPSALRKTLAAQPEFHRALTEIHHSTTDDGATVKWLFQLPDESSIETVLMHHERHSTVCVSSQSGCAMGCTFCATGQLGFTRQLAVGEIVEQVVIAARASRKMARRLDHVVFMGMGEPLANFKSVWGAVERIVVDLGLAARHITISTVGIVPGIKEMSKKPLQVNLAVSLHAGNDALRDQLVPINRRYPLETLIEACEDYLSRTNRRISLEWALIDNTNDSVQDAKECARIARRLRAHVNVIPMNPITQKTPGLLHGSPPSRLRAFRDALRDEGVNVTIRRTRGREIDAACGQLAANDRPLSSPVRRKV